jgi:hypothetical protein
MPKIEFSQAELQRYFSGTYFHKAYNETRNLYYANRVHSDGDFPGKLIRERRPSESGAVFSYRASIWEPITMPEWGKVVIALNKIRRSSDWSIKFDQTAIPPFLSNSGRTLAAYLEKEFPNNFVSLTNWLFSVLLPAAAKDGNALVCTMPIMEDRGATDFVRPFPVIFHADQVIDYVENDYAVLRSSDRSTYQYVDPNQGGSIQVQQGQPITMFGGVYYIVTTTYFERYEQINNTGSYQLAWRHDHNLGRLPICKTKGILKRTYDNTYLYDSRLSGMVPKLNEAVRDYSDLQAAKVQHLYPKEWEYETEDEPNCDVCGGEGVIHGVGFAGADCTCNACNGSKKKPRGPYTVLKIKQPLPGEAAVPTPPMGTIQRDVEVIKVQREEVDNAIYSGLSACQMQFLFDAPLNQSGKAKEVDKDELNTFVHAVAEDLVAVADWVAMDCCDIRYSVVMPMIERRYAMLPTISVPEKFDILSADYLEAGLKSAIDNKVSPVIVNQLTIQYANKKFPDDPEVRDRVTLQLALDPLAGVSDEDKMVRLSNGGITKLSYITSSSISELIEQALDEKGEAFVRMPLKDKKALIKGYAIAQMNESTAAKVVLNEIAA